MSTLEGTPGLIRMIMIDTDVLPGRMDEISLTHHTAMMASNGAGKTSILNLQPIFLGAKMSDVAKANEHKKSFIEYYLPRETSYIAYEYRSAQGEIRSVVLHSDPQKQRLQYRFVRSGITLEMFQVKDADDSPAWVKNSDFDRNLRSLNIQHAERLITSTQSYRAIMQNRADNSASGSDRQYQARVAADYSITTRKSPLTGVDKLMTHMLSKTATTKSLLGVIARHVSGSSRNSIFLFGDSDRSHIGLWPAQLKGYNKVMDMEPEARRASSLFTLYQSARTDLGLTFNALQAHSEDLGVKIDEILSKLAKNKIDRAKSEAMHRETVMGLDGKCRENTSTLRDVMRQISAIDEREARLRDKGADKAADVASTIPGLRHKIDLLIGQGDTLTSKSSNIAVTFHRQRDEINTKSQAEIDRVRMAAEALTNEERTKTDHAIDVSGEDIADLTPDVEVIRDEVRECHKNKSDLQDKISQVGASPEVVERHSLAEKTVSELSSELSVAEVDLRRLSGELTSVIHEMEMADQKISLAKSNKARADASFDEISKAIEPHSQSLHHMLRKSAPGWGDTIGKVISPALLSKTNLSPSFVDSENQGSIFGLSLDLSKLESATVEDDAANATRQSAAAEECRSCEEALVDLELAQSTRLKSKIRLERSKSDADAKREVLDRKLSAAQQTLHAVVAEKDADIRSATAELRSQVDAISAKIEEKQGNEARLLVEIKSTETKRKDRVADLKSKSQAALSKILSDRDEAISSIIQGRDIDLENSKKDEKSALSDAGVDVIRIQKIEADLDEKKKALKAAKECLDLAGEWSSHLRNSEQRIQLVSQSEGLEALGVKLATQLTDAKAAEINSADALLKQRQAFNEEQEVLEDLLRRVSEQLRNKPDFISPIADRTGVFANGAEANLRDAQFLDNKQFEHARDAKVIVKKINLAFRSSGDQGSGSASFLLDAEQEIGELSVLWVPEIMKWFDGEHQNYLDNLMLGMEQSIQPLLKNFKDLKDLQLEIKRFNKQFRDAIDRSEGFPNITGVDLNIECSVTDEPFWSDLVKIHEAYMSWRSSQSDRPTDDFIQAVVDLLSNWDGKADPVIHIEDIIGLRGTLFECGNERRIKRNTNLSDISSTGNSMIVHLIVFTALLDVLRKGSEIQFVWAVDEIAAVDAENTIALLNMLAANNIVLLTASPTMDRQVKKLFPEQIRIHEKRLYRVGQEHFGIREWIADGQLDYPGNEDDPEDDE